MQCTNTVSSHPPASAATPAPLDASVVAAINLQSDQASQVDTATGTSTPAPAPSAAAAQVLPPEAPPAGMPPGPAPGGEDPHRTEATPPNSDHSRYQLSQADAALDLVYGDHIHQNDGSQLDGGIIDDLVWQNYYKLLVTYTPSQYTVPRNSLGQRFLDTLSGLITGIVHRQHNSEKLLVFILVMLQRRTSITRNQDIAAHLAWKLTLWDRSDYHLLVEETIRDMHSFLKKRRGDSSAEERIQHFQRLLHKGEVRRACRFIAERETGGVLQPTDLDTKSGDKTVADVLEELHPAPDPEHRHTAHFPNYVNKSLPNFVPLALSHTVIKQVASRLHGAAGLGGTDAPTLKSWLLRHRKASDNLCSALARLTTWVANQLVPWAAIRALMSNRLVALDKKPGVRPIGIGQIWRRFIAKLVLAVAGPSATQSAGMDQLCVGMQSGIEGAVHAANKVWEDHTTEPDFGFLLLDANNAFNRINRSTMLYVLRYQWPAGALFAFNCYKHYSLLVSRSTNGTKLCLYSRTGVTQGCPIAMLAYGLGLLPLIRDLKHQYTSLFHSWYADDGAAAGRLQVLAQFYKDAERLGRHYGYYLNPDKCIIITTQENLATAHRIFRKYRFNPDNIVTGKRYLGGYLGDPAGKEQYLKDKINQWVLSLSRLSAACHQCPQAAYCALQKSLQMEWQYVQRVVDCSPALFAPLEDAIAQTFLPALFHGTTPPRTLTSLPRKAAGLSLSNPEHTKAPNYSTSIEATAHLSNALTDSTSQFSFREHTDTVKAARSAHKDLRTSTASDTLLSFLAMQPDHYQRIIKRATSTGQWLSVIPTTDSNTILAPVEFIDSVCLRYGIRPQHLPKYCDGCHGPFTIEHSLNCKKDGLVILRHNELRDQLAALAAAAFTPSAVRLEPKINAPSTAPLGPTPVAPPTPTLDQSSNARGDLLVRGLVNSGTDTIIDFQVTHLDSQSYLTTEPLKLLQSHEHSKNRKYKQSCIAQRRDFVPFIASCDGLIGPHAKKLLQRIAQELSKKWSQPFSSVTSYVYSRISLSLVRSTYMCLRGSRIPASSMSSSAFSYDETEGIYTLRQH